MVTEPFVLSDDFVDDFRRLVKNHSNGQTTRASIQWMLHWITDGVEDYFDEKAFPWHLTAHEKEWLQTVSRSVQSLIETRPDRLSPLYTREFRSILDGAKQTLKARSRPAHGIENTAADDLACDVAITLEKAGFAVVTTPGGLFSQVIQRLFHELGMPDKDYGGTLRTAVACLKSPETRSAFEHGT